MSQYATLLLPSGSQKRITHAEARLSLARRECELISESPMVVRSLASPLFRDELRHAKGVIRGGATKGKFGGQYSPAKGYRVRPPYGHISEDYLFVRRLLRLAPVKRGM